LEGLGKGRITSTLYYFISEGTFPKPVKLGKRTVAWKKSKVDAWIESRETALDQTKGVQDV
jgi:prophage regulatory protein